MTFAFALVRAVHFLSLMLLFGSGAAKMLVGGREDVPASEMPPRPLVLGSALAALITAPLWLAFTAAGMSGTPLFDGRSIAATLTGTLFGHAMIARLVLLAALLCAAIRRAPRLRTFLAAAALVCVAPTSHAAAVGSGAGLFARALNDAVHLLAAGFWLGGLCYLLPLAVSRRHTPQALVEPLRRFSGWGILAVATIVVAGSLNAWLILWSAGGVPSAGYEAVLGIKIALAALMISLALVNRMSFLPGLRTGREDASNAFVPSVAIELALGVLVVCAAALLGLLSPHAG